MTAASAWALLAAALALWPGGRPKTSGPRRLARSTLVLVSVLGVAVACLTLGGLRAGAVAALVACPLTVAVVRRLPGQGDARGSPECLPLVLDLVAAALRAGQPIEAALVLAAPAGDTAVSAALLRVSGLLRLGADPAEAWRPLAEDPVLQPVAAAARRSATSGIRLAAAFEQVASEQRTSLRAAAETRAARAGVLATAPLALCFLPAFVCLGIVPAVAGIASGVLTTLR